MSIADRTACSASSEYGGCRSRNGSRLSGGAIEYSTDELDIFPGRAFPGWIPQQRGGVIGDDQRHAMKAMHVAPELSDRQLRLEKSLGSERPKSKDCFWSNQFKLTEQVRAAGGYFVRHWIAVSRRPVLQHVADENVVALQIHGGENLCEQLTGGADERETLLVFCGPRRLADDHEIRVRVSLSGHGVRRGRVQRATRARGDALRNRVE